MADIVETKWLRPMNWDGFTPLGSGYKYVSVRCTGSSDGTGETNVVKVARQDLALDNGVVPAQIGIKRIKYNIHGLTLVIEWDFDSSDDLVVRLNSGVSADSSNGCMNFKEYGCLLPTGEVGTGDIVFTTTNADAGDTYDVVLDLWLKG